VHLATTTDSRVHAYDVRSGRIRVIYDGLSSEAAPLLRVDQLTVSPGGELFVCEDISTREIDMGLLEGGGRASRFLSVTGPEHRDSELTGVAFAPSGRRMYFASQRARKTGAVYEVTGPFRGSAGAAAGSARGAARSALRSAGGSSGGAASPRRSGSKR
jgi:secreted PhoX family phosphatase